MKNTHQLKPAAVKRLLARGSLVPLLCFVSAPSYADDALVLKALTEQGQFWESKGRSDLAISAWRRLLQIDPRNTDALAGLARYEIESNRPDAAKAIVDELKRQPQVNREAINRIESAKFQKSLNMPLLEQARSAARAGKNDEAVVLYRQLFEGRNPPSSIAQEYYQTLAGTDTGWDEARKGFERLRAEDTDNLSVQLAYAQHLTYRAATRREGIRLLSQLSRKPQVGSAALDAWQKALTWLDASRTDASLYQSYLKAQPNDPIIKARIASLSQTTVPKPVDSRSSALRDAYAALDAGDVADAEKRFEAVLGNEPKNADALGGLGVVRLRQERFAEAEKLLSAAAKTGGAAKWAQPLNTSRFWQAMQEGQARQEEKRFDLANEAYSRAQKLDPNALEAKIARIAALDRLGRLDEAKSVLDTIKDGNQRREAGQLLIKRQVNNAMEAKEYAEVERLLTDPSVQIDAGTQETLAWARYHQGKLAQSVADFAQAYRKDQTKGAASGLVFASHKQKNYVELLSALEKTSGPLRDLVSPTVQQKIERGETRFELDSGGHLLEIDPTVIFTEEVLWPATMAMLKEKNPKKAYEMLAPVESKIVEVGDFGGLVLLGQAATEVGDEATAIRAFKKASEETEDETFYFMLAQALIRFGRDAEAEPIMLKQVTTLDAAGLTILGWNQTRLGKLDEAADRFAAAYDKDQNPDTAQALVFGALKANKLPMLLTALDKHPKGPLGPLVSPDVRARIAAGDKKFGVNESGRLMAQPAGSEAENQGIALRLEPHFRSKPGTAGEGKLRQSGLIATLSWQGESQRASLEVEQQLATDAIERAKGQRWYAKWGMKMATHIDFQVGVGRTLSGGAVKPATVGEAGLTYISPGTSVGARLFRRGNDESLLALAGNQISTFTQGFPWGRALEKGVTITAYHKPENWESLGYLTFSSMDDGVYVPDNRKTQLYARSLLYLDSIKGLALGGDFSLHRFSRNLSGYLTGHGGYFSPSLSVAIGPVVKYEARMVGVDWLFLGGVGWNSSKSDAAAANPVTGDIPGHYPATRSTGIGYHARMQGLKPLTPNWNLGFGMGAQKGANFSDWRANAFLERRWKN